MSGLPNAADDTHAVDGLDVREQGNALRVATNRPHLVSLGTGRLSTAVTLHPIKQGRVTIGSDPSSDIPVQGTGVHARHARVENSHGVLTLYPLNGSTLVDGLAVDKPVRLSQGCMLTIGRSNYLRFNNPEEAKLMKSVLPNSHLSMAPIQFVPNEECGEVPLHATYDTDTTSLEDISQHHQKQDRDQSDIQYYQAENFQQKIFKDSNLNALDKELDMTLKEMNKRKPPVAPRRMYREFDQTSNSSSSEQEYTNSTKQKPSGNGIMAKVSKFEYYAKSQQKNATSRSQFYTTEQALEPWSPKVFSSNSLTVNTPAKDVLGGKEIPSNYAKIHTTALISASNRNPKVQLLNENNAVEARNCSYANVVVKNQVQKIDRIAKNFDDGKRNYQEIDSVYEDSYSMSTDTSNIDELYSQVRSLKYAAPSPSFDRNPQFVNTVFSKNNQLMHNSNVEAENMRQKAHAERLKDEEQQEAENARLEEILNMCAEYEKQISSGLPLTPTEKRPHNKIITNGSLPRTHGQNSPNFIQTSDGFYKFDTTSPRSPFASPPAIPYHRNPSSYENVDARLSPTTEYQAPRVANYENVNIGPENVGIPTYDSKNRNFPITELSSPVMIRRLAGRNSKQQPKLASPPTEMQSANVNGDLRLVTSNKKIHSPIGSPYENVYANNVRNNATYLNLKPKSPNSQSPRTRIKTTFAHKNLSSPQYFIFPTPPPVEDNSKMLPISETQVKNEDIVPVNTEEENNLTASSKQGQQKYVLTSDNENRVDNVNKQFNMSPEVPKDINEDIQSKKQLPLRISDRKCTGIEKQLSLEEDIQSKKQLPLRISDRKCTGIEKQLSLEEEIPMIDDSDLTNDLEYRIAQLNPVNRVRAEQESPKILDPDNILGNDLEILAKNNQNLKLNNDLNESAKGSDRDSVPKFEDDGKEPKSDFEELREERRKLLLEMHDLKKRMANIRAQEDDILQELEMEKALIKGEYDSEIAILNIEQQKKVELVSRAKSFEADMKRSNEQQELAQEEMRGRLEVAALKVERIEKDVATKMATMEELRNAQDILENERKMFEDLEFQHLEEETDMLAYREDLQNEIIALTKKIESQKSRILTLKSEASGNLTSALDETKTLQAEYVRLLGQVETMTTELQELESVMKKLNLERPLSPDSLADVDHTTRVRSGEFDYSPPSSDNDDYADVNCLDSFEMHKKNLNDKFNLIDQMSRSMIVDIGDRRDLSDLIDEVTLNDKNDANSSRSDSPMKSDRDSPIKTPTSDKAKKGFWERNFDSLSRLKSNKKSKSPPKQDIMSQSLNENMFFNNENIESDFVTNSLKLNKTKIPTFSAFGKMIRKDSIGKKNKENHDSKSDSESRNKNRYVKNNKQSPVENKYLSKMGKNSQNSPEIKFLGDEMNDKTILYRKSCGDEPSLFSGNVSKISDAGKVPSQDDIDRISKVTTDAPILSSDTDMNSLGRRTLDSLMEIERNRMVMLEQQGCQVIENEREKILELKKRVQNETKMKWESQQRETRNMQENIAKAAEEVMNRGTNEESRKSGQENTESFLNDDSGSGRNDVNCLKKEEAESEVDAANDCSVVPRNKDERQTETVPEEARHSQNDSLNSYVLESEERCRASASLGSANGYSRPLSQSSNMSVDNAGRIPSASSTSQVPRRNSRRSTASHSSSQTPPQGAKYDTQRPLTRYLPIDTDDLNLRQHIESAGHQVELCPHVSINSTSCRGYLHKLGAKFHTWSKRWFVFDRESKTFIYYSDKSEKKPRGGAYFQVIEEVYLDHLNVSRSPNPQTTFVVKTRQRRYYLMCPSGEAARIWIDVIFTGAQGYTEYLQ